MGRMKRWMGNFAVALAAIFGSIGSATAQIYPSRPITIVVPFAAGGPTDTIARIMAERLRLLLGQTVIIENVTGEASGPWKSPCARWTGAAPDSPRRRTCGPSRAVRRACRRTDCGGSPASPDWSTGRSFSRSTLRCEGIRTHRARGEQFLAGRRKEIHAGK